MTAASIPSAPKAAKVWTWLQAHPASTADQVARALFMPRKNTAAILSAMEREGFVATERIYSEAAKRHVRTYTAMQSPAL